MVCSQESKHKWELPEDVPQEDLSEEFSPNSQWISAAPPAWWCSTATLRKHNWIKSATQNNVKPDQMTICSPKAQKSVHINSKNILPIRYTSSGRSLTTLKILKFGKSLKRAPSLHRSTSLTFELWTSLSSSVSNPPCPAHSCFLHSCTSHFFPPVWIDSKNQFAPLFCSIKRFLNWVWVIQCPEI